jgi:hypothetical protein
MALDLSAVQLVSPVTGEAVEVSGLSVEDQSALKRIAAKGQRLRPGQGGMQKGLPPRRGGIRGMSLNSDQASVIGLGTASPAAAGSSSLTAQIPDTMIGQLWLEDAAGIVVSVDSIKVYNRTVQLINSIPATAVKRTTFHSEGICFDPPLKVSQLAIITVTVSAAGTWGMTATN